MLNKVRHATEYKVRTNLSRQNGRYDFRVKCDNFNEHILQQEQLLRAACSQLKYPFKRPQQ